MTDTGNAAPGLQFDTAVSKGGAGAAAGALFACANCSKPILSTYYDVAGRKICAECRTQLGRLTEKPVGAGPLVKAGLFGLCAGIVGAAIYYAVIAITGWEIGIVAILIGYMVGYAVRAGAGGGSRRFQVMAVALTYAAVAMAYAPLAIRGAMEARRKEAASVGLSTGKNQAASDPAASDPAAPDPASSEAASKPPRRPARSPLIALVLLAGIIIALPVLAIIGSLPSGLISAAIIFFGMQQAWKMTGAPSIEITGPYRVATPPAASA